MKALWRILFFVLVFNLSGMFYGQTNASGFVKVTSTRSFGGSIGVMWSNFTVPTLPSDAVVKGIYPVVVFGPSNQTGIEVPVNYGTGLTPETGDVTAPHGTGGFMENWEYGSRNILFSGEIYHKGLDTPADGIGTNLGALPSEDIVVGGWQTISQNPPMADQINVIAVGFAVYYTSVTAKVNPQIPPPFSVPHGQGVAWAVPQAVAATGYIPYSGCIFCGGSGDSSGVVGNPNPQGYEHLAGNIHWPDATHYNGTMTISMQKNNVKNICNYPYLTVPRSNMNYKVVDSVPIGLSAANYISQDCLSPRVPYYVELTDDKGKPTSSDNWYVPNVQSGTVDIGSMQESKFTGPITVAIPQAIISTPTNSQTITQPTGTSLDIYGTVNFHGTVGYTVPMSYNVLSASQILVNGVLSSSFPLDVNGIINASGGFCVAGCSTATIGQALVFNGTSFVPGMPNVTFPNLYYQTLSVGNNNAPQRSRLNFDSGSFIAADGTSATTIGLKPIFAAGTYTGINSFTFNNYGQVTALSQASTGAISRTCNSAGCYVVQGDGTIIQWGTVGGCYNGCSSGVSFPTTFSTTTGLSITTTCVNSPGNCMTSVSGTPTATGFTFRQDAVIFHGGGGAVLPGSQSGSWIAVGH